MNLLRKLTICLVPATVAAAAWGETFEDVEKALDQKAAAVKSLQCRVQTTSDMQTPDMKYAATSDITFQAMRKGDKWLYRSEGKVKSTTVVQGQETRQDGTQLMVQDGQFLWSLSENNGQKTAMKMAANNDFSVLPDKKTFELLKKTFNFKLVGEESVDGKSCWVVEAAAREPAQAGGVAKTLTWYDRSTGVSLKSVAKDGADKTITTSLTSEVKIDAAIAEDRFTFKAPEGVQVMDMTQQQGAAEQPAQQPKEEAKKEEPKKEEPKKEEGKGKIKLPKLP